MKQIFSVFALLIIIFSTSYSQSTNQVNTKVNIDENTIVKSPDGTTIYPYAIWQKLAQSGKYYLRKEKANDFFTLAEMTPEMLAKKAEAVHKMPMPKESAFFKTGNKIASFKESDMNGNKFNLKELKGKVVVLNFWFINCPPCRQEIPDLNEMKASFADKDVVFIAVALDEKYDLETFLKTTPFNYNIIDNGKYIANQYRITAFPTHVVIDKEGVIKFHTSGLAQNTVSWLKKSINEALKS
ncbi:MAG: TlpA disulfide reductase family protein [Flavobacterium sp.]|nr:TlpA disulfide reductase family protein [Flavobacterium sp.]